MKRNDREMISLIVKIGLVATHRRQILRLYADVCNFFRFLPTKNQSNKRPKDNLSRVLDLAQVMRAERGKVILKPTNLHALLLNFTVILSS